MGGVSGLQSRESDTASADHQAQDQPRVAQDGGKTDRCAYGE